MPQGLYGMTEATGRMHHANQQHDGADKHHHALHGVVEHAGTKAAVGRVERDADTKDQQAGLVRNTRRRLQQPCAADKLHRHCADKRHQQANTCQPHQQAAPVAAKQHVVKGYRVVAPGQNGKFLAQNTQRQPDRRQLDHRQQHPAEAIFIGRAGTANKRAGADIGGGQRHRQHHAAHGAAAEEVFV